MSRGGAADTCCGASLLWPQLACACACAASSNLLIYRSVPLLQPPKAAACRVSSSAAGRDSFFRRSADRRQGKIASDPLTISRSPDWDFRSGWDLNSRARLCAPSCRDSDRGRRSHAFRRHPRRQSAPDASAGDVVSCLPSTRPPSVAEPSCAGEDRVGALMGATDH